MTTQLFAGCPYDGCENGYCACLEQDLDEDDVDGLYDDGDPEELEPMFARGRAPRVETVPIPIDDYQTPANPDSIGAAP